MCWAFVKGHVLTQSWLSWWNSKRPKAKHKGCNFGGENKPLLCLQRNVENVIESLHVNSWCGGDVKCSMLEAANRNGSFSPDTRWQKEMADSAESHCQRYFQLHFLFRCLSQWISLSVCLYIYILIHEFLIYEYGSVYAYTRAYNTTTRYVTSYL